MMETKELRLDRLQTIDTFITMKLLKEDKQHLKKIMFGLKFKPRTDRPRNTRDQIQAQIACGEHLKECFDYPYTKISSYTHMKELNRMIGWASAKLFRTRQTELSTAWFEGFREGIKNGE